MILSVAWLAAGEGPEWGASTGRSFSEERDGHLDWVVSIDGQADVVRYRAGKTTGTW